VEQPSNVHRVVVRLADGGHVEVGAFATHDEAEHAAAAVADRFRTAGAWPRFGARLVHPAAVVSVDVVSEAPHAWSGSPARRVADAA
jgi:hypothetical protein